MRVKFTIAVCALLMLGLAVTQVNAQGFNVSKSETYVVRARSKPDDGCHPAGLHPEPAAISMTAEPSR